MLKGYYEIYEVTSYGEKKIASFQSVDNIRIYIEANCPNLNEIVRLKLGGKCAPWNRDTNFYDYVPITEENANLYEIHTKGYDILRVEYIKFDD